MKSWIGKVMFALARHASQRLPLVERHALAKRLLEDEPLVERYGFDYLSMLARRLNISRVAARGRYGTISSSPHDSMIFWHYARYGTWATALNDHLLSFFREGRGSYLDIGANIGLTVIPLARRHPSIVCHAFEPEPANYDNLAFNISENCGSADITLHRIALHDREGLLPFEIAPRNLGDHRLHVATDLPAREGEEGRRLIDVPCKRLDDLGIDLEPPVLVKIDAQGAEPFVINGGRRTLAGVDAMLVEWSPYHMARLGADPKLLLAFMKENFHWGVIHEAEESGISRKGHINAVTNWLETTIPAWVDTLQQVDVLVSKPFPE